MKSKTLFNYWNPGSFFDNVPGLYFEDANGGGAGAGTGAGTTPAPVTKTYTQEDLDRMFSERASRATQSARDDLFKTLGVKDDEELKTLLAEGKKLKESQQSDLEKIQTEKKVAEDKLATEQRAHEHTKTAFTERLLKAEVLAEAKKAGFRDESLADVWMLVDRTKITEKDDAFVGVDKAVEEIKKARPYWLAGEDRNKPRTPGTPRTARVPGEGNPQAPKRPARGL